MNGNKQFLVQQLMWIGVSLAISFTISMLFPFYISLPLTIGIFIGLNYYMRRRMMKKMGMMGLSSMFGDNGGSLSFYCMNCGTKHNLAACPKCGSKMKKASF